MLLSGFSDTLSMLLVKVFCILLILILNLKPFVIVIGQGVLILAAPPPVSVFFLGLLSFRENQRNSILFLAHLRKPSIAPWPLVHVNSLG
jgi:hypothetical protein